MNERRSSSILARTLRTTEYFTLAFGTMVGVGWLILIDDWLIRGGPGGGMLGFLLGGLALFPVAYVYGRFVREIPNAGTELAYTSLVFPQSIGFVAAWLMALAYLIVCPWEAVAVGKLAAYLFPSIRSVHLYTVGEFPVYLPALILGLAITMLILILNYRGIKLSSRFQNYTTFGLLIAFAIFVIAGFTRVETQNYEPLFSQQPGFWGALISVILVLQIVPYFLTGFESVPKCAEEAHPELKESSFSRAIYLALFAGILFYVVIIAVVTGLVPWQSISSERYATALAFRTAFESEWIVKLIFFAAFLSLLKVFNGNFIAATRLIFALGRQGLIPHRLASVHKQHATPSAAVIFCGVITLLGAFLGDSILIPITEVGSLCSILGWLFTCLAFLVWRKRSPVPSQGKDIAFAAAGTIVAALLLCLKLVPMVPGSLGKWEYFAFASWLMLGVLLWISRKSPHPVNQAL